MECGRGRTLSEASRSKDRGILADGIQHRRSSKFGSHFAEDMRCYSASKKSKQLKWKYAEYCCQKPQGIIIPRRAGSRLDQSLSNNPEKAKLIAKATNRLKGARGEKDPSFASMNTWSRSRSRMLRFARLLAASGFE